MQARRTKRTTTHDDGRLVRLLRQDNRSIGVFLGASSQKAGEPPSRFCVALPWVDGDVLLPRLPRNQTQKIGTASLLARASSVARRSSLSLSRFFVPSFFALLLSSSTRAWRGVSIIIEGKKETGSLDWAAVYLDPLHPLHSSINQTMHHTPHTADGSSRERRKGCSNRQDVRPLVSSPPFRSSSAAPPRIHSWGVDRITTMRCTAALLLSLAAGAGAFLAPASPQVRLSSRGRRDRR